MTSRACHAMGHGDIKSMGHVTDCSHGNIQHTDTGNRPVQSSFRPDSLVSIQGLYINVTTLTVEHMVMKHLLWPAAHSSNLSTNGDETAPINHTAHIWSNNNNASTYGHGVMHKSTQIDTACNTMIYYPYTAPTTHPAL